jgi:hypothetical protein
LWDPASRILVFSANVGSTALRISAHGSQLIVEQLWRNNKLRSVFSNLLLVGDVIYRWRGSYGPGFLTSADIKTGETGWSARGFANANFLRADGKLIAKPRRQPEASRESPTSYAQRLDCSYTRRHEAVLKGPGDDYGVGCRRASEMIVSRS